MTAAEELVQVDAALKAIYAGHQSYRMPDGFEAKRADLGTLLARKKELEQLVSVPTGIGPGGLFLPVAFGRPC